MRGRTLDLAESDDPGRSSPASDGAGVERGVLIPCSDLWSQAVSHIPDEERGRFPTSMPSREVVDILVDKGRFADTLDRFDVPHPTTLFAASVSDLEGVDLDGFFLKPRDSQRFSQLFRKKAIRFADRAEAVEGLQAMVDAGLTAVLQEYVPGPPTAHYFVDGFVDLDRRRAGALRPAADPHVPDRLR